MRARRAGLHALVGAYVMDAVSEADRADFERHLPGCEQCQEDVRGLREATARLAAAASVRPRPELREHILQTAARVRQLPPHVAGHEARGRRRTGATAGRGRAAWPAVTGRQPWLVRVAVVSAVALACTAVVLGLHLGQMQSRLTAAQKRDASIAAIMGAHDAVTMTTAFSTGGTGTVVMSHRARALVFVASGLPQLPAGRAYEVWLMGPVGNAPAGMLPAGRRDMMVVSRLKAGDRLGVTVERASGAPRPTTVPIVVIDLGS